MVTAMPNGLNTCAWIAVFQAREVQLLLPPESAEPEAWVCGHCGVIPPVSTKGGDGMSGEGRCVRGDADAHGAAVVWRIMNAVGNAHSAGIGTEVVIVHQYRRAIPFGAGVIEVANQFAFLAVDADDGESLSLEASPLRADVLELLIAVGAGVWWRFACG
jgi:hypothetical protein